MLVFQCHCSPACQRVGVQNPCFRVILARTRRKYGSNHKVIYVNEFERWEIRHILMYMPTNRKEKPPQRKAKVFMNNRSQAVRLPKEFQFNTEEVFIRKKGSEVVLSSRPFDWTSYLAEAPTASANFMEGIEDLPVQEREP